MQLNANNFKDTEISFVSFERFFVSHSKLLVDENGVRATPECELLKLNDQFIAKM